MLLGAYSRRTGDKRLTHRFHQALLRPVPTATWLMDIAEAMPDNACDSIRSAAALHSAPLKMHSYSIFDGSCTEHLLTHGRGINIKEKWPNRQNLSKSTKPGRQNASLLKRSRWGMKPCGGQTKLRRS